MDQEFDNPGFENSGTCSATNCSHEDIDCIEDWWNFISPQDIDDIAWFSYDCNSETSCGGERAILAASGESLDATCAPTTTNPLFGEDRYDKYIISMDVLPLEVESDLFIAIRGAHVANDALITDSDLLGFGEVTTSVGTCGTVNIFLNAESICGVSVTSYPYLVISANGEAPDGLVFEYPSSVVAIDNISACKAFDISINERTCEDLCVSIKVLEPCNLFDCGEDCYMSVFIDTGEEDDIVSIEELDEVELCLPFNESGEYTFWVGVGEEGESPLFFESCEYAIAECNSHTVTVTSTWTVNTVPNLGKFDVLTIEDGVILTVESDVILRFCPEGKLIIQPNAELRLHGTLTSSCDDGWEGVKVYGDYPYSQYYDLGAGKYHQGSLITYEGALIENAWVAVELFGPDPDDSGGRIKSAGTTFRNNRHGVRFAPYVNYASNGQPRPYLGSFRDCVFTIDDDYLFEQNFAQHIQLRTVNGVLIHGCDFENLRTLTGQYAYVNYGYGIHAVNSGFTVSAITSAGPPYDRSSFIGLGVGVRVLPTLANKYFEVSQSDFAECYNGIVVDGVSMGTIVFNHFEMGEVPDPEVVNWELYEGGQVGVIMRKGIAGFALEENDFVATEGNTDHTIGIVGENLGASTNLVRRNSFEGISNPNQGVGLNGGSGDLTTGLTYLCNENEETTVVDFYVPGETVSPFEDNIVAQFQNELVSGSGYHAAGNIFSQSGSSDHRDFANYGGFILRYWYYNSDAAQVPEDYFGLVSIHEGTQNSCLPSYCSPPCPTDLEDDKEEYLDAVPLFYGAVNEENWDTAVAYKAVMDRAAMRVVQFYLNDTLTFDSDSLLLWYHYLLTPVGEILRSKYYASKGDFTTAGQLLAAIPNFYELSPQEEDDLDDLQEIYDILDARGIENLTSGDFEDLEEIASHPGHGAALARGILSHHDYHFGPEYYLPDEEEPYIYMPQTGNASIGDWHPIVYPNPSDGDNIVLFVPYGIESIPDVLEIADISGRIVYQNPILMGANRLRIIPSLEAGLYFYHVRNQQEALKAGVLVVTNHK